MPAIASDDGSCSNANTQAQMNTCAAEEYQRADGALNSAYREVMARLTDNAPARAKLRAAQRAWISFRDAECAYVSSATEGGSVQAMVRNQCLTHMTSERTQTLQEFGTCEEGDLSCVRQ
ncbi:lysozyme inhibitor LprI family protein [Halomonas dongshanensis]|uniref:Lysozyme inhibitor LprI family protein n=1 Tax=Halomonas dongshanensis TaxID=2890835 RepID=A0ABT2EG60_9GAMM|nr:lysozyme inhibitor LprI family protein [Halomonas dongshanensis]MCS2610576.1 lysozyme inhibitor LprI family protein [Halomonas dongshanensis]